VPLTTLPLGDRGRAREQLQALRELGVTGVVHAGKYESGDDFAQHVEGLLAITG